MLKKSLSGDPSLRSTPFNPMVDALAKAGVLHTKKGTPRKHKGMPCKACKGFVEFLGMYKSAGFCNRCGDELRGYAHYSFLRHCG